MKRKPTHTQKLIQSIMERCKITDLNEAWRIYRQKYEQDVELDPDKLNKRADTINTQNRRS